METIFGSSIFIYVLIKIILPITLFIGVVLICIRLGAILDLLEKIDKNTDALIKLEIIKAKKEK